MHRDTPTPSECEEFDDAYNLAFRFWLELQNRRIHSRRFLKTAEYLDSLPGVLEYFRTLCHYKLQCEAGIYTIVPAWE